jgi:DNA-binding CsgD family transcriptional regulator
MGALDRAGTASPERKRRLLADLCRILGTFVGADTFPPPAELAPATGNGNGNGHGNAHGHGRSGRLLPAGPDLAPRLRQTLDRLLAGDSEKQIASHLRLSKNTVHVYVKALYRRYEVCSRGELLARFVSKQASRDVRVDRPSRRSIP